MNTSNLLAERTRQLIKEVKPDTVMVQANPEFSQIAKLLNYVHTQEEMNVAKREIRETRSYRTDEKFGWNIFWAKFYFVNVLFRNYTGVPFSVDPTLPGLETKYAIEEGEAAEAKIVYLGNELDPKTWKSLHHETRISVAKFIKNFWNLPKTYKRENMDNYNFINHHGWKNYVESRMDSFQINWFIQMLELLFPPVKRILVEKKDEDLFRQIMEHKGKRSVVLVNQWHMEGIEHHWCHGYGQRPRNMPFRNINPVGDFDLRDDLLDRAYHVLARDWKTGRMKSSPASYSAMITPYDREGTFQLEHRNM